MGAKLMAGFWRYMLSIPPFMWEKQISKAKARVRASLGFMTDEHRAVHHCIVRELPKVGEPISPEFIADRLTMSYARVKSIFKDLEKHMTFICRNSEGLAVWAYPVTVEKNAASCDFQYG